MIFPDRMSQAVKKSPSGCTTAHIYILTESILSLLIVVKAEVTRAMVQLIICTGAQLFRPSDANFEIRTGVPICRFAVIVARGLPSCRLTLRFEFPLKRSAFKYTCTVMRDLHHSTGA